MEKTGLGMRALRLLAACALVGVVTGFNRSIPFANATTVALSLLLVVLAVATAWGLAEAISASVVATLCLNYFFLPPVGTWSIADPENWVALFSFLVVSIVASQLSERTRRMALESAQAREAAAQADMVRHSEEFKSTLLDALAHELKTPLTSLKASASALRANAGQLPANDRELLTIVEEETDRLNHLITEVLRLARLEAGKLRLHCEPCTVDTLIGQALEDAKPFLSERQIQMQAAAALPPVSADLDRIRTVLKHLLDNAAKYSTRRGSIAITAEQEGQFVRISVRDQGPGLREEELSAVFEKYYRGAATRDAVPGMGLGLGIVRDIVTAHGGRIWAESSPGEGTRFSFTLPVASEYVRE